MSKNHIDNKSPYRLTITCLFVLYCTFTLNSCTNVEEQDRANLFVIPTETISFDTASYDVVEDGDAAQVKIISNPAIADGETIALLRFDKSECGTDCEYTDLATLDGIRELNVGNPNVDLYEVKSHSATTSGITTTLPIQVTKADDNGGRITLRFLGITDGYEVGDNATALITSRMIRELSISTPNGSVVGDVLQVRAGTPFVAFTTNINVPADESIVTVRLESTDLDSTEIVNGVGAVHTFPISLGANRFTVRFQVTSPDDDFDATWQVTTTPNPWMVSGPNKLRICGLNHC